MDKKPQHTPDNQDGAKILPFRRPQSTELARAILRHPACGHETIEQTLRRLGEGKDSAIDEDNSATDD